jgi:hypothetical protein
VRRQRVQLGDIRQFRDGFFIAGAGEDQQVLAAGGFQLALALDGAKGELGLGID